MKIATWNVNSIRARLDHVLEWLDLERPDVLALQETKVEDEKFPVAELEARGYLSAFHGQKSYNGVAILSREALDDVAPGLPGMDDGQSRVLRATLSGVRVICVYVPNGQSVGSEKFAYKLEWMEALRELIANEAGEVALVGDMNVAPEDRDIYDPKAWSGSVLCSEDERAAFRSFLGVGFQDAFRLFDQPPGEFSWWDYRAGAFRKNLGLRIDHVLVSGELAARSTACRVDRTPRGWPKPSDHAPVVLEVDGAGAPG